MALYNNTNKASAITAIEFPKAQEGISATPQEQFFTFHVRSEADKDAAIARIASPALGLSVVAESKMDGHPLIIARGAAQENEVLHAFGKQGEKFEQFVPEKKIDYWKLRGWGSLIGQPLQLMSAYLNKGGMDGATATFAISNLIANGTNILFGAEKTKDAHHLRVLKASFNRSIAEYVPDKTTLPDIDHNQLNMRPVDKAANPPVEGIGGKLFNFMQRYSVTVGEIGLRFFGAIALAFPVDRWKDAFNTAFHIKSHTRNAMALKGTIEKTLKDGLTEAHIKSLETGVGKLNAELAHNGELKGIVSKVIHDGHLNDANIAVLKESVKAINKEILSSSFLHGIKSMNFNSLKQGFLKALNADKFTKYSGLTYIVGKSIALTSKVPDPYNPAQHTALDTFREKYSFRLASVIETAAAGFIAYDRLFNRHITVPSWKVVPSALRGAHTRDWLGGIGGVLFMAAQGVRFFAPFGVRSVDMKELNAHMAQGLAKIPPEKLPKLLADTAVSIKKHFGDKAPDVGQIFVQLTSDLKQYHGISIPGANDNAASPALADSQEEIQSKSFSREVKQMPNMAAMPRPATYQEKAAGTPCVTIVMGA